MLHLITGSNGAGKTLFTLKWVMERAEKEGRPVCHNGRFAPVAGGPLANWKAIDFKDWQAEPDGTIFLIDECHNDIPVRSASAAVPDAVKMLAEHRRRGMDFYLITQHPQNIDNFVRRLIGSPGWHRHLKRAFGGEMISCIEWDSVNAQCEKQGSGRNGTVSMQGFPKEVFAWYKSASLHTGKRKIPKAFFVVGAAAICVPAFFYFAISGVYGNVSKGAGKEAALPVSAPAEQYRAAPGAGPLPVPAWLDLRKPRLPDFPHTAPLYDEVTRPTVAPYPAACVSMGARCECFTQQGTLIPSLSRDVCLQVVKQGYFVDWQQPQQSQQPPAAASQSGGVPAHVAQHPMSQSLAVEPARVDQDPHMQALANRNAQVRSVFR